MNVKPLSLRNVSHAYGTLPVLRNVSLEVESDEFVSFVGPSGCGKTTLLNLLGGFESPDGGELRCSGSTRMVYQHDGLFPWLTAAENVALGIDSAGGIHVQERQLNELLNLIRLDGFAGHYPHQLSGGMRRRVELARALASPVDVLLMDEPFAALDYQTRHRLQRELVGMLEIKPRTVVLVTHDVEEAALLSDRVIVLTDRPAQVQCEFHIELPHPRDIAHPQVLQTIQNILRELMVNHGEFVGAGFSPRTDARR